jgi:hypothetical protein
VNAHLVNLEWTEDKDAKLKALVDRYTSHGSSGAWRVHRWRPACFWLVLGYMEDHNDLSGHWYDQLALDTGVDSLISRWLRETFLPMLVKEPAKHPEPDEDNSLREALLPEQIRPENALPSVPTSHKAVLFRPPPGKVRYFNWWLTTYFVDHVDIFHMYAEMGNDEGTEMQLKIQDSRNPSVIISTPKVGGTGQNLTAANHQVIIQKFWVLI